MGAWKWLHRLRLSRLHAAAMREHVAGVWGWDEGWQRTSFERRFATSVGDAVAPRRRVLERLDEAGAWRAVGHVELERSGGGAADQEEGDQAAGIDLHNLQIGPAWQGRGIGTQILRELQREARARGCPLRLKMFLANAPARRLYARLGFEEVGYTSASKSFSCRPLFFQYGHIENIWSILKMDPYKVERPARM